MAGHVTGLMAIAAISAAQGACAFGCADLASLDDFAATLGAPEGAICATYLASAGTTGTSCHWRFSFRDVAANTLSDDLWRQLTSCRRGASPDAEQPVNHPDSYDLREWRTAEGTYAISVKDKGALGLTLVFLRFEPG